MNETLKLLDMNLNRATEGLRTIEDIARLVRPDAAVCGLIKNLRHKVAAAAKEMDRGQRLASRNVQTDQGTHHRTAGEEVRDSWADIVAAAAERITQSLRCLEEFSKPLAQPLSLAFKTLRYQAYDDLAFAEQRLGQRSFPQNARLYLLVDCQTVPDEFESRIEALSIAGVDVFQLRDKRAEASQLVQYAKLAIKAIAAASVRRDDSSLLIINDRVDIALATNADGVHLGQEDIDIRDARAMLPACKFIGLSTHDVHQVEAAKRAGADYIGCGPTFPSQTKQFDEFAGLEFLASASAVIDVPNYAIGGITSDRVAEVMAAGCTGVAVSAGINARQDPVDVAKRFAEQLVASAT